MASITIPASKSLTISDRFPNKNINKKFLSIGNDGLCNFFSYLFFDLSSIPCNVSICYAELILFKADKFYNDCRNFFGIYPLNASFNKYTSYNNYPEINATLNKYFNPMTSNIFVKIPFTSFARLWTRSSSVNGSILLYGKSKNSLVHFYSAICKNKCHVPFLKITFEPFCNKPTLRKVQVTGTVAPQSKYNAVVNIKVSRYFSNHIDSYYVVDQYDNSVNNAPLYINKIYNIAIIPKETKGDLENVTFYGSYKE